MRGVRGPSLAENGFHRVGGELELREELGVTSVLSIFGLARRGQEKLLD